MKRYRLLLVLIGFMISPLADAHKPSDSYVTLNSDARGLHLRWAIALRDLEVAVGLDSNADGEITWGELQAAAPRLNDYALSHLDIYYAGKKQRVEPHGLQVDDKTDGAYAVLLLHAPQPPEGAELALDYRLLFEIDPTHRGLITYSDGQQYVTRVAAPNSHRISFPLAGTSALRVFGDYFVEGAWHIWVGFDHILFLLTLLLPAVLVYREHGWQPVERVRPAFREVVKTVTAFTLAHSLTLALATLKLVVLPSRLVESVIAFSVLVTALNNLRPVFSASRWMLAFGFGLIHGFGFASVLTDLGLPTRALALALTGFNLGVEAGQLAIVAVIFPFMLRARSARFYRGWILRGGSVAAALIATAWMLERAFDYRWTAF